MEVALAGPPQTRSFLNSYRSNSISAVYWAYLSSLGRGLPVNEGLYAPLHVDIGPPGTIVNPVAPAASYACTGVTFGVVFSAVCQALSCANPERACAAWLYQNTVQFGGTDPRDGEPYAYMSHLMSKGGGGAYYGRDGGHMWGIAAAGGANMTGEIELLELRLPIHVVRHELLPDSGCPGRWRGGCGADLEIGDSRPRMRRDPYRWRHPPRPRQPSGRRGRPGRGRAGESGVDPPRFGRAGRVSPALSEESRRRGPGVRKR